jgi:hypothetical protein
VNILIYCLDCFVHHQPIKKFAKDDSNTIISQFLGCSKRVADHYKDMYTIEDVKEMAERLGYTDKEIQKLKL